MSFFKEVLCMFSVFALLALINEKLALWVHRWGDKVSQCNVEFAQIIRNTFVA